MTRRRITDQNNAQQNIPAKSQHLPAVTDSCYMRLASRQKCKDNKFITPMQRHVPRKSVRLCGIRSCRRVAKSRLRGRHSIRINIINHVLSKSPGKKGKPKDIVAKCHEKVFRVHQEPTHITTIRGAIAFWSHVVAI